MNLKKFTLFAVLGLLLLSAGEVVFLKVYNNGWKKITNKNHFSYNIPKDFGNPEQIKIMDIGNNGQPLEINNVDEYKIPESLAKGTNLSQDSVIRVFSFDGEKNCWSNPDDPTMPTKIILNNKEFDKVESDDAGAGNFYHILVLWTKKNNVCYVVYSLVHTTNIYNYPDEIRPKEFNLDNLRNTVYGVAGKLN